MSQSGTMRSSEPRGAAAATAATSHTSSTLGASSSRSQGTMGLASAISNGGPNPAHNGIGGSLLTNQQLASTNPRGYSSFTESDQDGSSAVVSLNGTQIVMNNMARSRAPLPGFSSFV